jgi:L-ribulose-5-phosphate 3-epimerase
MGRVAIMQGRLLPPEADRLQSFPRRCWQQEFALAAKAGLDAIEWIYDTFGEDENPLNSDVGIAEMRALSLEHNIAVVSVCADWFMDRPIVRSGLRELAQIVDRLSWLLARCGRAGIERVVLPFVDQSRIQSAEDEDRVVSVLSDALPEARRNRVELHLETSLAPMSFSALLARLSSPWLKANYDSGNSSSLGYRPQDEFAAYGQRVGSVHIKDRLLGGSTVPLGTGNANFAAVFQGLAELNYGGDYVLQVARGAPGAEVDWARQNRVFLMERLHSSTARAGAAR